MDKSVYSQKMSCYGVCIKSYANFFIVSK